jgi:hypothetical protein
MMLGTFKRLLSMCGYPQRFRSPLVAAQSAVPASVTGTAAETTLATIAVPVGSFNKSGAKIRVTFGGSVTSNANTKTFRARLGGVQMFTFSAALASTTAGRFYFDMLATGPTSQSTLNGLVSYGTGGSYSTTAVDMTQAQNLTLTMQLATSTDTFTLADYTVEILNP